MPRPPAPARLRRAPAIELHDFLPYVLHVTAEQVSRLFSTAYVRRFGLSVPEWRVMANLGDRAARPTPEVIERTGMDPVKVSRAVTRLADKGLATRAAHPRDQRVQLLRLTPAGLAMYREIVPAALALLTELTAEMGAAEQAALLDALRRLEARARRLAAARRG